MKPQGYGDVTTVLIEKSARSFAHLAVLHYGRDSPVDEAARKRLRLLAPHICRAVAISQRSLSSARLKRPCSPTRLTRLRREFFSLQEDGSVAYANASGRAILKERRLLQRENGAIQAVDLQARSSLHRAFVDAASGRRSAWAAAVLPSLWRRVDGERYVADLLSLTSGARRGD